jgi:hypothetical protein
LRELTVSMSVCWHSSEAKACLLRNINWFHEIITVTIFLFL